MQGEEVGDQTEEGANLTSQKEEVLGVVVVEEGVEKEELVEAGMTTTISPLILDRLVPAGIYNGGISYEM